MDPGSRVIPIIFSFYIIITPLQQGPEIDDRWTCILHQKNKVLGLEEGREGEREISQASPCS